MMMILYVLGVLALEPQKLVYAAGYMPNVQFAPFYVAASRGYYKQAGIDLEMDYTIGPDTLKLVALGKVQMGSADPDAFLHATVQHLPLVHVATLYQTYPIALIAKEDLFHKERLKGKRVGVSGAYGSSYLGLKALLTQMGLELKDIQLATIGFTQTTSLSQGRVDAVVGYINNEPLRLGQDGIRTFTYALKAANTFPGVGIMTSEKFMKEHPDLVEGFLKATFHGMSDVVQDPESCFALVVDQYMPELRAPDKFRSEYEVLLATLQFWKSSYISKNGYGQCEPDSWETLAKTLAAEQANPAYTKWREHVNQKFLYKP